MDEIIIIKCPVCKTRFCKKEIGNEPTTLDCNCNNITVEVRDKEDEEKNLFLVKYREKKPVIKVR